MHQPSKTSSDRTLVRHEGQDEEKRAPYLAARQKILLEAAEHLIREEGSTEFTMLALSRTAGVSPTTPYNVFETKAKLLFTLLNRSIDSVTSAGLRALKVDEPFERVIRSAELAAGVFTVDSGFYRPLYNFLLGVSEKSQRQALMNRAIDFWWVATDGLEGVGAFLPELPRHEFSYQLTTNFLGLTDRWAHAEITDDEFVWRAAYGTATMLLAVANQGKQKDKVLAQLRRLMESAKSTGSNAAGPLASTPRVAR